MKKRKILSVLAIILSALMILSAVSCATTVDTDDGDNGAEVTEPVTLKEYDPSKNVVTQKPVEPVVSVETTEWMDVPGANGNDDWKLPKYETSSDVIKFLVHYDVEQPKVDDNSSFRDVYGLRHESIVVPPSERVNKFISMVLSSDPPDILMYEFQPQLVNKGYLEPWDSYIDFNLGIWSGIKNSIDNLTFQGGHYSIDALGGRWEMVWYNLDIFEEYGHKTPMEYYKEGNWNWDTFRECAKDLTVDLNSDGTPDIWGCAIASPSPFVYTTGIDFVSITPDGAISNNMRDERIARAMNFYIELVMRDKCIYLGDDINQMFTRGALAMMINGASAIPHIMDLVKEYKTFFVPFPRDPGADKYYIAEGFGSNSLAKGAPNPEGSAAYFCSGRYDWLNTDAKVQRTDEENFANNGGSNEMNDWLFSEFYKDDLHPALVTWVIFGVSEFWGDIWYRPTQGEPWATIAEEVYPRVQDSIERLLDN